MIFALVGNQNAGKTTLFNALTGSNQHVGNFPGVTVDQKVGQIKELEHSVVDLPGIYSIRPYSPEEKVTRDFIMNGKPDGILNIVDATNIERNLYLTLQLLTLRIPTVIAMNMMDEFYGNGWSMDVQKLSAELGVPVVPISAVNGDGISELINRIVEVAETKQIPQVLDFCPDGPVHRCIHSVMHIVEDHAQMVGISRRFCATKLIEGDSELAKKLKLDKNEIELLEHTVVEMENETGLDRNEALADMRYNYIEEICSRAVKKEGESREHERSRKIDTILTGRYTAIPVFVAIMALIFVLTFNVLGVPLQNLMVRGIAGLSRVVDKGLVAYGINPVVKSLIIEGIFGGVGSVLSFLPIIIILFFLLSILEDTGYMARIAFVMDRLLRKIGLSGKSFVPLLVGFGCTVPAVMATRTLPSERDRKLTIMLVPYMSCSAKVPIYAFFSAAFFPEHKVLAMVCLYFGGILMGILAALVLRHVKAFSGKPVPFMMELPNYRMPGLRNVFILLWEKAKDYITKAFTIIFVATIAIWFLQTFDSRLNVVTDNTKSLLSMLGHILAPVFKPAGFGDWRVATSLVTGLIAKEAVVSTIGVLIGGASPAVLFSVRSAISCLAFILLYTPCCAAIAAIRHELASVKTTIGVVVMQCLVAWAVSVLVWNVVGIFV